MDIKGTIKQLFLMGYATTEITLETVVICLLCTTAIAFFIYYVYKLVNKNSFYNKGFNLSLVLLSVITSSIILTIQSNIVVSLGMVGALSIVRFRTAVKDPLDLVFLFWSISVGIICGAGFALIALIASLTIALVISVASISSVKNGSLVLVVNANSIESEKEIMQVVSNFCRFAKIRSRNASRDSLNMAIEVCSKDETALVKELLNLKSVDNASLVEYDGSITA